MKKVFYYLLGCCVLSTGLTGCNKPASASKFITVVSREDGSGTRGAFIELTGVEQKNEAGKKVDLTTVEAEITNSTAVMMTTIAQSENAIGYISLGSLNESIKAVAIDGAAATADAVKDKSYPIARPFQIVTSNDLSKITEDFIAYIMSEQGQKIVVDNGYVSEKSNGRYEGSALNGKITIAGSSSVTPVMEKLKEGYLLLNPEVKIEIQQSDSTTGAISTMEGVCDIGMLSRNLKESEVDSGLTAQVIALDGIAVIVHPDAAVDTLSIEQVRKIFTGEMKRWNDL